MIMDVDVTFPRVPCYRMFPFRPAVVSGGADERRSVLLPSTVLSMDIMDISGEHQLDLTHAITKNRLDKNGKIVGVIKDGRA